MKLNDSEWIVMNALWDHAPASAREVLEKVEADTDWAYTTVKTILARLVEKQVVDVSKRANTSFYLPLVSRKQARGWAVHSLIDKAFDGTFGSLIQHLMVEERLSRRDRKKLTAMLDELDRGKS